MKVVKTDVLNLKSVIETPMRLSEFNTNERYEDIRSVVNFLINLILMVPGTIPEMPKMGYNLHSRRHFIMNSKELARQQMDLQEQISSYCDYPVVSDVSLYPISDEVTGDQAISVIEITLITGQKVQLFDDGYDTQVSVNIVDGKNFFK